MEGTLVFDIGWSEGVVDSVIIVADGDKDGKFLAWILAGSDVGLKEGLVDGKIEGFDTLLNKLLLIGDRGLE